MQACDATQIELHDGRHLAFVERGDPDGVPILFFHGTPGSRCFRHPDDSIASGANGRVIHVDRPGIGRSDPKPGRTLVDWAEDVVQLVNALGVDRFAIAGISGGGPYAMACAWAMPERVSGVAVVSGMAPLEMQGAMDGMSAVNRIGLRIARHASFLLPLALSPMARAATRDPRSMLDKAAKNYSEPDQRVMERAEIRDMYAADIAESYRQGVRGHAEDLRAVASPWGFDLRKIRIPVYLWQGEQDRNVPPGMARQMGERIPDARARMIGDQGHLLLFDHWAEILSELGTEF